MPGLHSIDWYPVRAFPFPIAFSSQQITQRPCRLYGFSFTEVTGTTGAGFQLLDGGSSGGAIVVDVSLVPNESTRDWYGKPGILIESGLFLNFIGGAVRGAVWILPLTEGEILKMAAGD